MSARNLNLSASRQPADTLRLGQSFEFITIILHEKTKRYITKLSKSMQSYITRTRTHTSIRLEEKIRIVFLSLDKNLGNCCSKEVYFFC